MSTDQQLEPTKAWSSVEVANAEDVTVKLRTAWSGLTAAMEDIPELVSKAVELQVWLVRGYKTLEEWMREEVLLHERRLDMVTRKQIVKLLTRQGVSQVYIAMALGVSESAVSRAKTGTDPNQAAKVRREAQKLQNATPQEEDLEDPPVEPDQEQESATSRNLRPVQEQEPTAEAPPPGTEPVDTPQDTPPAPKSPEVESHGEDALNRALELVGSMPPEDKSHVAVAALGGLALEVQVNVTAGLYNQLPEHLQRSVRDKIDLPLVDLERLDTMSRFDRQMYVESGQLNLLCEAFGLVDGKAR